MADAADLFTGLSAFPPTPATSSGELMVDEFASLLSRLNRPGIASVGVLGSTGGAAYLDRDQRRRAIETARAALPIPVIAGVGALRSERVIEHALDAQHFGADAILLNAMSYTPLNEREVIRLFERVDAAVSVPICIYNNPTTTRFTFSPALIGQLSGLEHVCALKDGAASQDELTERRSRILPLVDGSFRVGMSGDRFAAEALIGGAATWYSTLAGTLPEACIGIATAVADGDFETARRRNAELQPMWELMSRVGSIRVIYALVELLGLSSALPPEPLLPLDYDDKAALILALEAGVLV